MPVGPNLANTMSGMDVKSGVDQYSDLPPEALAAVKALLSISSAPNALETAQANQTAGDAYSQLQAEIANAQAPTPAEVPQGPGDLNTFLGLLSANLAGTVNPAAAKPGYDEFAAQRKEAQDVTQMNREEKAAFQKKQTERSLESAAKMTEARLKLAQEAGDDRAATEKALQLQRINDALARRREKENDERQKAMELAKIAAKPATGTAAVDPDELDAAIEAVGKGETDLSNYPIKLRATITKGVKDKGWRIVPTKVRMAFNEVSAALTAVDEIARLSGQVNKAKAGFIPRTAAGLKNMKDALEQQGLAGDLEVARGGLAGNLARAVSAERGVLTDQDRKYAMALIPGLFDSRDMALRKVIRLRKFLEAKKANAVKAYMTPMQRAAIEGQ